MGFGGGHFWGGGPSSAQSNTAAGLPFSGIPVEMADRAKKLLEDEPEHPEPEVEFSHRPPKEHSLTLRSFLSPFKAQIGLVTFLVVLETLAIQSGPLLIQLGIDQGVKTGQFSRVVWIAVIFLILVVVQVIAGFARIAFAGRLGERLMYKLRVRIFSHLQRLSLDFYTKEKAGVLMTRMTSDIETLTVLFQEGLVSIAVQSLTLIVITTVLFIYNPVLAAVTVFVVIPFTFALSVWFRRRSDIGYTRVRDRIAAVLSNLQENLSGIRVISAHNRHRHNSIVHRNVVGDHEEANLDTARVNTVYGSVTEGVGIIGQAIVLWVGGWMVSNGDLTVGELTAFALYLTAFFAPIQTIVQLYNTYQQGQASLKKLRGFLEVEPSVLEAEDAAELAAIEGHISLRHVNFGYQADEPVLTDVNLEIPAGESLSIVGPTGAGKSTVAKLICRFYDPQEGEVSIDGVDVREVSLESLRKQLGVVPQEPFLFNGTIGENVAFSNPDASEEDIWQACQAVGLDALIQRLPEGLDTPCHERGVSLSSGERQLLALARAFLAQPRVLVLDEATSNLDSHSEKKVEEALDVILEGRTAVIIAHRLTTAMRADRIAVVDDGRIVEVGSHQELLQLGGHYAAMHQRHAISASLNGAAADRAADAGQNGASADAGATAGQNGSAADQLVTAPTQTSGS